MIKFKVFTRSTVASGESISYDVFKNLENEVNNFIKDRKVIDISPTIAQKSESNWLGGACWITISYIIKYEE